jgi:ABC-type antimicrobial peptide transport system permease subunit
VIGISRDIKHHDLTETPIPHFDLPALQQKYSSYTNFVLRVRGGDLTPVVRNELMSLDPSLSTEDISPMSEQIGKALSALRLASSLIGVLGAAALMLASVGLYGVLAWTVSRRTREIGVRIALGAQSNEIIKMILRQGLVLIFMGIVVGIAVSLALTRLIEGVLYSVSPADPSTYATIAMLLTVVALLACWLPARRAAKVDPMVALRQE